ncbi:sensor domain-containing diguanylate cyclase [Trujillonella endophytica]|uniref:PAS domain S-box-containing protein/diguanylate cyclase (GGDEF) domain-containing protein n=1 Tax=Trujillonella endophytica TaxID=673521 RepID=A0A1H8V985_9ACTN|nr:sensor domain-containing diguanylate cyclase [Trujillella endophytica]SEP11834.1 PAS domain S-box-containing protein/diguanylate cyclase (GGDEF) domain-containing protein [Trujillella endophytica]
MAKRSVTAVVAGERPPCVREAFGRAPLGMAICDPGGTLLEVNAELERLLGRPAAELIGTCLYDLTDPEELAAVREATAGLHAEPGQVARVESRLVRGDGSGVPVQLTSTRVAEQPGDPTHLVMVVEDITARKLLETELVHRSLHDALTGLPNRTLFADRLRHALERGHREQTPTCVLTVDLDGFKDVNDRYGHPMGDAVLVAFAARLTSVLRASDTAARLGGDEFSIVCENTERADAEVLAERLRTTLVDPLDIGGTLIAVGMSVGIGTVEPGADPDVACEQVVRAADDAMYADKQRRR